MDRVCKSKTLSQKQIVATLNADDYVSFGSNCSNIISVVPLVYAFEYCGGSLTIYLYIIYGSREYYNITCNPYVSLEFENKDTTGAYNEYTIFDTVTANGPAIIVTDPMEMQYIKNKISDRNSENRVIINCIFATNQGVAVKVNASDISAVRNEYTIPCMS